MARNAPPKAVPKALAYASERPPTQVQERAAAAVPAASAEWAVMICGSHEPQPGIGLSEVIFRTQKLKSTLGSAIVPDGSEKTATRCVGAPVGEANHGNGKG